MDIMAESMTLFPIPEPFNTGFLAVDDLHKVYYEESGRSDGKPVLFVHGGPGGGIQTLDRCYFDPNVFRIILFDQRGCGKSTPEAELKNNTTWDLVEDIETLRKHLGVDKWLLFGGSWGSSLCLAYGQVYPDTVKGFILRGIFTLRKQELDWLYQDGACYVFPDFYKDFIAPIPENERGEILQAYYRRLTGDNEEEKHRCAKEYSRWECRTSKLVPDKESIDILENKVWTLQISRIECHYFVNKGWFKTPTYLLDNVDKISHLPCCIVQGRYDMVCPTATAWDLHKRWPNSELCIVPDAGHSSREPGITTMLLKAVDKFKDL
ncbi:probable proline iminopeptidase [Antedon mediterranea]|uniref:probable proline iminopeptidase n=1 Tax=Antedon mediterranea TaxID=105859 RepID=UPI003AF4DD6F